MSAELVNTLIHHRGIESDYIDAWGNPAQASLESQKEVLIAMGYNMEDEKELTAQFEEEKIEHWTSMLTTVQVFCQDAPMEVSIKLPVNKVEDRFSFEIETEQQKTHSLSFVASEGKLIEVAHIGESEFRHYSIRLPFSLSLGYHQLRLNNSSDERLASQRLIVTPQSCFRLDSMAAGKKVWGLSVQLYCLRSRRNWGIGDFTDLAFLTAQAAQRGANFIGLNPIHALYPANPYSCSPYSPSSRRWLNSLYLDVTALEGYEQVNVKNLVDSDAFQQRLQRARNAENVDYEAVINLKVPVLKAIFDFQYEKYLSKNTKLNKAFKTFVAQGGESLEILAVFEAIQAELKSQGKACWGWPVFGKEHFDYRSKGVNKFKKDHAKQIKFYMFLQWQAALQLEKAHQVAKDSGMIIGLYRDLAVGVSEESAEIWGNKTLYCTDVSVGAPPDILGPLGQTWGLPPMDPQELKRQGYQPIIDLFASNMQSCSALRIDHVMGMLRLWWVRKGLNAKEGAYINYPVDDLLGILALESHRHQCQVIGEDLGTVPEEISRKLADKGIYSYKVFFFEQADDGGFISPTHYAEQSMATLTTHDMPTLTGYWHCLDLELGKSLGLYNCEEILNSLYHSRHHDKQRILDSLHGHHVLPDWLGRDAGSMGMSQALNFGMQQHLASGSSALLSLQLEDWLQMDKPVNVPGTSDEYPNWRRKLNRNLEDIFADADLNQLASDLTQRRRQASTN